MSEEDEEGRPEDPPEDPPSDNLPTIRNILELCPYCRNLNFICKPCLVLQHQHRCISCCKKPYPRQNSDGAYFLPQP